MSDRGGLPPQTTTPARHDANPMNPILTRIMSRAPQGLLALAFLPPPLPAEDPPPFDVPAHYAKYEYRIPMRDGVHLFTAVYVPRDESKPYPFFVTRTPYSAGPYGEDHYPSRLGPPPGLDE